MITTKQTIIATYKEHLQQLIKNEIKTHGNNCDLNHIDVSNVTNMSNMFYKSTFNGNISKWNVSNVTDMSYMFEKSTFNGDISNWNVSNVTNMQFMFYNSTFNGDISNWNVSNVTNMSYMFKDCPAIKPWWDIEDYDLRQIAINNFNLMNKLNTDLSPPSQKIKKNKI